MGGVCQRGGFCFDVKGHQELGGENIEVASATSCPPSLSSSSFARVFWENLQTLELALKIFSYEKSFLGHVFSSNMAKQQIWNLGFLFHQQI